MAQLCFDAGVIAASMDTCAKMKGRAVEFDVDLDCEGLLCPLPVLRARKRLLAMSPGAVLCVRATDPMAAVDLPHFCVEAGHGYLGCETDGAVSRYFISAKA